MRERIFHGGDSATVFRLRLVDCFMADFSKCSVDTEIKIQRATDTHIS